MQYQKYFVASSKFLQRNFETLESAITNVLIDDTCILTLMGLGALKISFVYDDVYKLY